MKANIAHPNSDFMKSGSGFRLNAQGQLVANATTLRHDEGKLYDDTLIEVAQRRLNGIEDLRKRGLVKTLGGLGTILSLYERVGEMTGANVDMDGRTRSANDRLTFDEVGVPIPIFHKEWELGERYLLASRQRGEGLDTTQMRMATRAVVDSMEDALFNGISNFTVAGLSLYGYTTHPDRSTHSLQCDWTSAAGADIIHDVQHMLTLLLADKKYGPYVLYVANNIMVNLQSDYSTAKGDNTILQRIMAFNEIIEVKVSDFLTAGDVVMVQMDHETVDIAIAQDLRNLQWNTHPLATDFMVLAAMAPRIKSDRSGNCGVCHGS